MNATEQRIYQLLRAAADAGEPCPSNAQLAAAVGFSSTSSVHNAVSGLERAGHIVVQRFQTSRVVAICGTGAATALTDDHLCYTRTGRRGRALQPHRQGEPAVRGPACPSCGTRADHGCACPPRPFAGITVIPRRLLEGLSA